jgi:hypothetical protein
MKARSIAALPLLLVVVGCQTGREAMPARLEISAPTCATAPNLASAVAMVQPAKDEAHKATLRFDDAAACLADAKGNKAVYGVVDLGQGEPGSILTVTSYAMGSTVFSPRLELRDVQGALMREVSRDTFLYNNSALQTQLRVRAGERYLVIASDTASVGQSVEHIQSSRTSTVVPAGPIYVPVNTGGEARAQLVFAHSGEVATTLAPMPKAN